MTLSVSPAGAGLSFNPDFFSAADMAELAAAEIPADLARRLTEPVLQRSLAEASTGSASITVGQIDDGIQKLIDDLNAGTLAIEGLEEVDLQELVRETRDNLGDSVLLAGLSRDAATALGQNMDLVRLVEKDGFARLEIDGTVLLSADLATAEGRRAFPVLQLVTVVMDVIFVLIALAGVNTAFGDRAKQAGAEVAKSSWQRFRDMVEGFVMPIRSHMAALREAKVAGQLGDAVMQLAGPLCKALFNAGKAIYQKVWGPTKNIFAALFSSLTEKVKALFALGAFVCSLFASAGMALLGAVVGLIGQVIGLVDDTIRFVDAV